MSFFEYIKMAFSSLISSRTRSFLTMLGIIVGISSIVTIATLGISVKETVQNLIYYQSLNTFGVYSLRRKNADTSNASLRDRISIDMLNALEEQYPDEFKAAVSDPIGSGMLINSQDEKVTVSVNAATDGYFQCNKMNVISGRELTAEDSVRKMGTAVVADVFVRQYFHDDSSPLGKKVHISLGNERSFDVTIVGVYKTNKYDFPADTPLAEIMTDLYIPYMTASMISDSTKLYFGMVNVVGNKDLDRSLLKQHLADFFEQKFAGNKYYHTDIYDVQEDAEATDKIVSIVILIVSAIGTISLIVGGIGVMNIMLVSVTERTKEIGIRKALGATNLNIRTQFVIEAVIICIIGGFFGVSAGIFNCSMVSVLADRYAASLGEYSRYLGRITVIPPFSTVVLAVGFSCIVGILSGMYPAVRASSMNPIEALRTD